MAKNKLTDKAIKAGKQTTLADGGRLYLRKEGKDSGRWYFRYTFSGAREVMGLGGWPAVSLAEARDLRDEWEQVLKQGESPKLVRERQEVEKARKTENTLNVWADLTFEALKPKLRNGGKSARWDSPLRLHVLPKLGGKPIEQIGTDDIQDTLKDIWHEKPETAKKAINRLAMIFDYAEAGGRDVSRQTVRRAKLLLGAQSQTTKHIPAMEWKDVPDFYGALGESTTELALRLLVLTGARSGSVRHCHMDQIDDNIWTIPAAHMKGAEGKVSDFRIPLSGEAMKVIELAQANSIGGQLFCGPRGKVISDMTLSMWLRRRKFEARPHGFRSSLRSWMADQGVSFELSEVTLAHKVGGNVSRAYQRSDLLDAHRPLMESWAAHVTGQSADRVVQLNA